MTYFKILLITTLTIFTFNGCTRDGQLTPLDVAVIGVAGWIILDPIHSTRSHHHRRHH